MLGMDWLSSAISAMAGQRLTRDENPDHPALWGGSYGAVGSDAGVTVSERRALQLPVVLDCLSVISETVAGLPLHIYERKPDGTRDRADAHPLADVLGRQPNAQNTAFEFFSHMVWQLAWHRNAYAEIVPGPRGAVDQLVPLQSVYCERAGGRVFYRVTDDGRQRVLTDQEVTHWRKGPLDSRLICGRSVLETSSEVLGRALAVQTYGATFFANNGMSGGIIESPPFESTEAEREFLQKWREARTGRRAHRDAMMRPGQKYHPATVNNEQAQFNETERQMDVQLARIWRMPPHKVGIMDKATFSNIEQQSIEFVVDTIMPWLVMIEQAISRDLIVAPGRYYAQFNVNGLLRGDMKSRFEAYAQAIQNGWLSPNQVRRLENLNPVDGGDTHFRNAALVPLDTPAGVGTGASLSPAPAKQAAAELDAIRREAEANES